MPSLSRPALAGPFAFSLCAAASALEHAHGSYGGKTGPAEWAALAPDNVICKTGQQQSPVDLPAAKAKALAQHDADIRYGKAAGRLVNNGHTLELDLEGAAGNKVVHQGVEHRLARFHFHAPMLYAGSLTTPPCTERVHWVVLERPIEMSRAQIDGFRRLFRDNHRPIQPLNGREPVEETAGE